MSYIKRFISQKCIGYSEDFAKSYYEGGAVMDDGSIKEVYCIYGPYGGTWKTGICPRPPIKNPEPTHDHPATA